VLLLSITGLVVVVLAVAGGSYLWFHGLVSGSHPTDSGIVGALEQSDGAIGSPTGMDILVIGSDKRPTNAGEETRSDTVMLVHADPDQNYLSILSFPRDLRVEVPGHGIQKLNAAYQIGGPELTITTLKQLTGVDFKDYIAVDFNAFSDITDELGGVYVDVDRRYYYDGLDYENIKLAPGYQLLNGAAALDYVRFRHDLNMDFGRMDRQQRFLTALREQAMGWNLPFKLPGLISALFNNLETTLGTSDILKLANWGVKLSGDRIRQLTIIGDIQTRDGVSYVIPAEGAVDEAVSQLRTAPAAAGGSGSSTATSTTVTSTPSATDPGQITGRRMWELFAASAPFQVMAPTYLPPGYNYADRQPVTGGAYSIVPGDARKVGLKVVYRLTREGEVTDQYLGIMETAWLDAPAASKGQELKSNGITYTFVGTNQKTDRIWWKQNNVLYWVSNTLSFYVSKKELLKVAESMITVSGGAAP
jgi:LCP family protein required for cell wall assembly